MNNHESPSSEFCTAKDCETADEFIDALSQRRKEYASAGPGAWVFRGHSRDLYPLLPTALREESKCLVDLMGFQVATNKDQIWSEREVLKKFLNVSDSTGLAIPEDTQQLRHWLEYSIDQIKDWPPTEILSLMALAQHHGVPTRLLDWSRSPMKAAWFAANKASESDDKSGKLCVWALSIELLEMLGNKPKPFTVITAPSATNSNLRAQEGLFTLALHIACDGSPVDRSAFDQFLKASLEKHQVKAPGPWFHRVTLPRSEAAELEFALAFEGVTRATLFPDFYGVVDSIKDSARLHSEGEPGARRLDARLPNLIVSQATTIPLSSLFPSAPP